MSHELLESSRKSLSQMLAAQGLSSEGMNSVQWRWRTEPPAYPHSASVQSPEMQAWWNECMCAVLDALVTQGCVPAWAGDGTGCVQQIVAAVAKAEFERGVVVGSTLKSRALS